MADQLYLSLWFPNFRFEALPAALIAVLRQFSLISKSKRVSAAAAYPISFHEAPTYQRLYVLDDRSQASESEESIIENAVAEATELLHEDTAYEFEMKWSLWAPEGVTAEETGGLDPIWRQTPTTVKFLGFGPDFDDSTFEQNGHIRIDFGLDTPWLFDDEAEIEPGNEYAALTAKHIKQNIEMLLAFTLSVEKHCGISSRLLWTESGEPLAEKLVARLQRLN
ncbi:hypothetical protein FTO74_13445 [Granulicella sp. WH15]|uniref:hypothetical protein n=1 Tax=Granulicella sp. WH15 TaxID=2602070 RepID=UPI0013679B8B|nr:hypothetical protein [Granulicella sp. WH15]QHN04252.1 hypothetical protein FTO74_13445 [Granulicella sp. WH15]